MSAIAKINHDTKSITISATLNFYGSFAEPILAEKIILEINTLWNEPKANFEVNELPYEVIFSIDYACHSAETILEKCISNSSYAENFIRIEEKNTAERSMMGFGLGQNSGHWLITDNLGESTTAAHEFGHAIGLPHPDHLDYRNTGFPPIMAPRGTLVDAQYQWNPLAETGSYGGTMRPIWRRVRDYEIVAVLRPFDLSEVSEINIGSLTNILYDEIGRPVGIIS
jgi:hypothetical protein